MPDCSEYSDKEEPNKHSSVLVPYSYYRGVMPDYYPAVTLHWHKEFEICMILSGKCTFRRGNESFTAKPGDIIIVQPNEIHSIYPINGGRVSYDLLLFHPRIITGGSDDRLYMELLEPIISGKSIIKAPICGSNPYYGEISILMENIFTCARNNTAQQDLLLKSELMRFFWLLIESREIQIADNEKVGLAETMSPVIEYIAENFSENITVDELAKRAHLSKSYFMKCFKKFSELTVTEYINQVRIRAVCELLLNTDRKVAEIAFSCGFRNIPNFNRRFKETVSCTPYEYRRNSKYQSAKK
ncbi:MAG: AraC family transcriptional regulator [Lachnospiraceae bacterium]|nr:AraC family transcriptional regulator [Lachnospiraceae bacterium]